MVSPRRHRLAAVADQPSVLHHRFLPPGPVPAENLELPASGHPGDRRRQPHGRRQRQDAARALDRGIPEIEGLVAGHRVARLRREDRYAPRGHRSRPGREVGDEPVVLSRRGGCPVWVGPDRLAVAAALRAAHDDVDVLVLDDGLQHYRLRRDLEVAVVDTRGFGNGFLLRPDPCASPPGACNPSTRSCRMIRPSGHFTCSFDQAGRSLPTA